MAHIRAKAPVNEYELPDDQVYGSAIHAQKKAAASAGYGTKRPPVVVAASENMYEDLTLGDAAQQPAYDTAVDETGVWWMSLKLDRRAAEARLEHEPPGAFVVRAATKNPNCRYVLTYLAAGGVMQHALVHDCEGDRLTLDNIKSFSSIEDLVAYYQTFPLKGVRLQSREPDYENLRAHGASDQADYVNLRAHGKAGAGAGADVYAPIIARSEALYSEMAPAARPRDVAPAVPSRASRGPLAGGPAAAGPAAPAEEYVNVMPTYTPIQGKARPAVVADADSLYGNVEHNEETAFGVKLLPGAKDQSGELEYEIEEEYNVDGGCLDAAAAAAFSASFSSLFSSRLNASKE